MHAARQAYIRALRAHPTECPLETVALQPVIQLFMLTVANELGIYLLCHARVQARPAGALAIPPTHREGSRRRAPLGDRR